MTALKKTISLVVLAAAFAASAHAATLSLEPGAVTVAPGDVFAIDLVISGLGDLTAPSVGAFDIDIGFDPLAIAFVGIGLGPGLGDVGLGEAIDVSFGEFAPGLVNVAEVSFLSDGELDGGQPDSFVLATLEFMAVGLGPGESTVLDIVAVLSLGDALGDPIAVTGVAPAVVTAIPLPAAVWLMAGAVLSLALLRRRA